MITLEADTTSDLDALPRMLAARDRAARRRARRLEDGQRRRRTGGSAASRPGYVVRQALGVDAHTVSSFFRVYRASVLRAALRALRRQADPRAGLRLQGGDPRQAWRGMGARIVEVPVDARLDAGGSARARCRSGRRCVAYWRMLVRAAGVSETPEPAGVSRPSVAHRRGRDPRHDRRLPARAGGRPRRALRARARSRRPRRLVRLRRAPGRPLLPRRPADGRPRASVSPRSSGSATRSASGRRSVGFYGDGRLFSMTSPKEFLTFPLLRPWERARLAAFVARCQLIKSSRGARRRCRCCPG